MRARLFSLHVASVTLLTGILVISCSLDPRPFPGGGLQPLCSDGLQNGDESDVDCGGSCPGKCLAGQQCVEDADCETVVCEQEKCVPDGCMDETKNEDESDVDCGGSCPPCDPGEMCNDAADCKGGECENKVCQESCTDGVLNNGETGTDCGGFNGCGKCGNGQPCGAAEDCESGFCPGQDKVCCAEACEGECVACVGTKTDTDDGTCAAVKVDTDPDNECEPDASSTCGNSDGMCNGDGACTKHPMGTACGSGPSCTNNVQTNQDVCDGMGACTEMGTTPCDNYECDATACKTICAGQSDCVSTAYCDDAKKCQPKKPKGEMCGDLQNCLSGFCVDGVCCNNSCGAICQSCDLPGSVGTCSTVPKGQNPNNECQSPRVCSGQTGNGSCKLPDGEPCGNDGACLNDQCEDGFCCATNCSGVCESCKLAGSEGICKQILNNEDPDNECNGAQVCNGAGACKDGPLGAPCSADGQCASNHCEDGVCCDVACTGLCQACSAALKGEGVDGECKPIKSGTDPEQECPDQIGVMIHCDGAGECKQALGTPCMMTAQCLSGFCEDNRCCESACGVCKTCQNSTGECKNVMAGTDPDNDCPGAPTCNGNGLCN
jgi:hypothetical protein